MGVREQGADLFGLLLDMLNSSPGTEASPSFVNVNRGANQDVTTGKQEDGRKEDKERGPVNIEFHLVVMYRADFVGQMQSSICEAGQSGRKRSQLQCALPIRLLCGR